jgi:hypothetical protein
MDSGSITLVLFVAAYVLIMGGVAVLIGNKQRSFIERFLVGFFFGPLGWWMASRAAGPSKSSEQVREERRLREEQYEREKADWKGERGES